PPLDGMTDGRKVQRECHLGFTPGKASDAPTYFVSQKRRPRCVARIVMAKTERLIQDVWRTARITTVTMPMRTANPPKAVAMSVVGEMRAAHESETAASPKFPATTATASRADHAPDEPANSAATTITT